MSYDRIRSARSRTVGTRQTTKAVEKGLAKVVFLARNADERVVGRLARLCEEKGVDLVWVDDMMALGKACGVEVGAASAAIVAE